jgi:TusA-related sulfurtransferase
VVKISESGKKLDVRGLYCPSPALQTTVELSKMQIGEILTVLADDPAAEDDITDLCRTRGHELLELKKNGTDLEFSIKKIR